eukprot:COSAG06_NODE_2289_length_7148_cov_2.086679_6_plen_53_part_00
MTIAVSPGSSWCGWRQIQEVTMQVRAVDICEKRISFKSKCFIYVCSEPVLVN